MHIIIDIISIMVSFILLLTYIIYYHILHGIGKSIEWTFNWGCMQLMTAAVELRLITTATNSWNLNRIKGNAAN